MRSCGKGRLTGGSHGSYSFVPDTPAVHWDMLLAGLLLALSCCHILGRQYRIEERVEQKLKGKGQALSGVHASLLGFCEYV